MEFYWAVLDQIAVGSLPYSDEDIDILKARGIQAILSLHPLTYHAVRAIEKAEIDHLMAPFTNFSVPSDEAMELFSTTLNNWREEGKPILIHCFLGRGRARTVAAAYLAETMTADEALERVGLPQTTAQIEYVRTYGESHFGVPKGLSAESGSE